MGSKNRHAKELLPIILKDRKEGQFYVEPFVGGFNMIDKVDGNRIANDINPYLIDLYKFLSLGWEPPPTISEKEYNEIKNDMQNFPSHYVGFVGFGCSFAGKFFGGYARSNDAKGNPRNHCDESRRNLLKQISKLSCVAIFNFDYWRLEIPAESIIYCDPPYVGVTGYKNKFNHDDFWNWVRNLSKMGHSVFISEYEAPADFEAIWEKKIINTLDSQKSKKTNTEKLFVIRGGKNLMSN